MLWWVTEKGIGFDVASVISCYGWSVGLKCMCQRNDDNDFVAFYSSLVYSKRIST